jgi:hypothetical protein
MVTVVSRTTDESRVLTLDDLDRISGGTRNPANFVMSVGGVTVEGGTTSDGGYWSAAGNGSTSILIVQK